MTTPKTRSLDAGAGVPSERLWADYRNRLLRDADRCLARGNDRALPPVLVPAE